MDVGKYNKKAWDRQVENYNPWTIPVGEKEIGAAQNGDCRIVLTPNKPIPQEWLYGLLDLQFEMIFLNTT